MEENKTAEAMLHAALNSRELPETMFGKIDRGKVTVEIRAHGGKAMRIFSAFAQALASAVPADDIISACALGLSQAAVDQEK